MKMPEMRLRGQDWCAREAQGVNWTIVPFGVVVSELTTWMLKCYEIFLVGRGF